MDLRSGTVAIDETSSGLLDPTEVSPSLQQSILLRWLALRGSQTYDEFRRHVVSQEIMDREDFDVALTALERRGDVHFYSSRSGDVVAAAARRAVILNGRRIDVGPSGGDAPVQRTASDEDAISFLLGPPSWSGVASTLSEFASLSSVSALSDEDAKGWRAIADRGRLDDALDSSSTAQRPLQLARLALLVEDWPTQDRETLKTTVEAWADIPVGTDAPDPAQRRVADLAPRERAVVEAGPGAGKTHTIRLRIDSLIRVGVSPARLLAISFTRAAVAELYARLAVNPMFEDVELGTLDSLAARFLTAAEPERPLGDFGSRILRAQALVAGGHPVTAGWLRELEHLIVDEAQDIVGPRSEFLDTLLKTIPKTCGVTIFCDPAQAIYGWQADVGATADWRAQMTSFHSLGRNHRAANLRLAKFASEARACLNGPDGIAVLGAMRERVREAADGPPPELREAQRLPKLMLFRRGSETAYEAQRLTAQGVSIMLRGRQDDRNETALAPVWFGLAAQALAGKGRAALDSVAASLSDHPLAPDLATLEATVQPALKNGRYEMALFARMMNSGTAPVIPLPPGTVTLSTIHAAKGREADDVALYLPREHDGDQHKNNADEHEEARVLYVAATRARRRLYVAPAPGWMNAHKGRFWQRQGKSLLIQISTGDAVEAIPAPSFDPAMQVFGGGQLRWDRETRLWNLWTGSGDDARTLASLPPKFARDISEICDKAMPGRNFVSRAKGDLRVRILTIVEGETVKPMPVAEGFARLWFAKELR